MIWIKCTSVKIVGIKITLQGKKSYEAVPDQSKVLNRRWNMLVKSQLIKVTWAIDNLYAFAT